ncbi:MFS transporter [Thermogymnomonas acidicola]|uniref:MFS transporter n=1 Tax=Thermogymnomonas acidicola TaxID=399579 RepID=A0AA37F996_9ARCH|nr:MFS transporter [Thermogymnomonas acidicola]GGM70987.1 MFS transporter [Thermogymnomonas acidicola]
MDRIAARNVPSILITFMLSAFAAFSISMVVNQLSQALHTSVSGVLVSVPLDFIGGAIGGVVLGRQSDRLGRRPMLMLAVLIFSVSLVAAAFISNIAELYALWFIIGIGVNSQNGISYPLLVETLRRSTGLLGSVMQGLYFIGFLLDTGFYFVFHYWRTYFLASGIFALVFSLPLAIILVEPSRVRRFQGRGQGITGKLRLYTVALSLITVGAFMLSVPLMSVVPTLFQQDGIPPYYTFVFAVLGFLGFAFAGFLADRAQKWAVTLGFSILGIASASLLLQVLRAHAILAVLVPSYISAGFFGFIGVWASQTYPQEIRAAATNIVFLVGRVLGGLAPFLASVLSVSLKDGMGTVMLLAAAVSVLGSLLYLSVMRMGDATPGTAPAR